MGVANTNSYTWTVGNVLLAQTGVGISAGEDYQVMVWSSATSFASSAKFAIADPCSYVTCGKYGQCSSATGQCVCLGGYTGAQCDVGPCARALCSPEHSTCSDAAVIASGQYKDWRTVCTAGAGSACSDGWKGPQCRTSPACVAPVTTCVNGGDLPEPSSVSSSGSATCSSTCTCINSFGDSTCSACSLQCQHGGKPNDDCSSCTGCAAGYQGSHCSCKYITLTFKFKIDVSGWFTGDLNSTASTQFARTLALDLKRSVARVSGASAADGLQYSLDQITILAGGTVQVAVRMGAVCNDMQADVQLSAGASESAWEREVAGVQLQRRLLQASTAASSTAAPDLWLQHAAALAGRQLVHSVERADHLSGRHEVARAGGGPLGREPALAARAAAGQ